MRNHLLTKPIYTTPPLLTRCLKDDIAGTPSLPSLLAADPLVPWKRTSHFQTSYIGGVDEICLYLFSLNQQRPIDVTL